MQILNRIIGARSSTTPFRTLDRDFDDVFGAAGTSGSETPSPVALAPSQV